MKIVTIWCRNISVVLLTFFLASCQTGNYPEINEYDNAVTVRVDSSVMDINIISENILNVRYYPVGFESKYESLSVIENFSNETAFETSKKGDQLNIITDSLKAVVDLNTSSITIYNNLGEQIFKESPENSKSWSPNVFREDSGYSATHRFMLDEIEAIYGMGQHQDGHMNLRGKTVDLFQHNMKIAMPVMVSSKGYGIFWDNYSHSKFSDKDTTTFWSEMGDGLNYYFIYGPEIDQVISGMRTLTGQAPIMPRWSFGLIQSRARYKSQEEITSIVDRYRKLNVPLDLIVQDWQYWHEGNWGEKSYDEERFPDPAGMLDELHNKYNVRYMISIWPCLEPGGENFREMSEGGFLYPVENERKYYDVFNPEARELYWKQTREGLFKYGVDAWWADATEPEINGWETDIEDYKEMMQPAKGSSSRYMNAYSLKQSEGVYNGQMQDDPSKRVMILTRSSFPGQQRYSAASWSGDVSANWEEFHRQIPAGLNFIITGVPYWTTDIGAFFVTDKDWFRAGIFPEGVEDPDYHEFFVRWYQYGAFSPLFRVHGAQTPREIWFFGKKGDWAYDVQIKYNNLRYRLLPYIYSVAGMVNHDDYTMMRPLVMDFREDSKVFDIDDQYMFGPAILVNPVTKPGVKTRSVYLPQNEGGWTDFWTGRNYEAGQTIEAKADIETLPLFIRAGSIVPMGPFLQYSDEKKPDVLEIRIYPGKDASFTIYEDEGDNNNYQNGEFCEIDLKWDEETRTLTVSENRGSYNGMPQQRKLRVVLVREDHGTGLQITEAADKTINYNGKPLNLKL